MDAFAAMYERGSINKADAWLCMSPPGFSKTIALFGGRGGGPLFSRPTRVEPTMHARSLYPKVKEIARVLGQVRK